MSGGSAPNRPPAAASSRRDALAVHAVDPAGRVQGLDADRYRGTAADLRGGFPAPDRRGHGEIEPAVLGRRQGGVRDIAIEALLLALLRAGRGHHQVAELACSVDALANPGSITPCVSCRPMLNRKSIDAALPSSPASGMVIVKVPTAAASTGRSTTGRHPAAADSPWPRPRRPDGQAGDRPGDDVTVVLAGDPPWRFRQLGARGRAVRPASSSVAVAAPAPGPDPYRRPRAPQGQEKQLAERSKMQQPHDPALLGVMACQGYPGRGGRHYNQVAGAARAQRFIITGRLARSSTCRVTPPRMSWRSRECE